MTDTTPTQVIAGPDTKLADVLNPKSTVPPPPAAIKHPNWFVNFFQHVGHVLGVVEKWAPAVAKDTITVIEDTKELEPAFKAALMPIIEDVATIAGQASLSVAQKGLNPMQDLATIQALEKLVKDFGTFYPVLQNGINTIKGVIVPTPPAVVAAEAKAEETAPITPVTPVKTVTPAFIPKVITPSIPVIPVTPPVSSVTIPETTVPVVTEPK